jgi:GxxExxY protein
LAHELRKEGYDVQAQLGVPVVYDEIKMDQGFRVDLLVNRKVIVEIKSVETLLGVHRKQLLTYLKLSEKRLGLLINFYSVSLKESITRIVNGL